MRSRYRVIAARPSDQMAGPAPRYSPRLRAISAVGAALFIV